MRPTTETELVPKRLRSAPSAVVAWVAGVPMFALGVLLIPTPLPGAFLIASGLGLLAPQMRAARELHVNGRRRLRNLRRRFLPVRRPA